MRTVCNSVIYKCTEGIFMLRVIYSSNIQQEGHSGIYVLIQCMGQEEYSTMCYMMYIVGELFI